ncbi:MAG: polyprenyl synthetase family protein, partial [Candidatus Aenigmarchaeota archaeon]|nr:polyprenyl synthetase family protein [Candidatus Aenigmarchaeota archaeon]
MEDLRKMALEAIPKEHHDRFLYSFESGKRIRPRLMKEVCSHLGVDFTPLAKAALAIEIFHCTTLLHDDIIDNDDVRRGRESFKARFSSREAVIYGDYFAMAAVRIVRKEYPSLLGHFLDAIEGILEGQIMEIGGIGSLDSYM